MQAVAERLVEEQRDKRCNRQILGGSELGPRFDEDRRQQSVLRSLRRSAIQSLQHDEFLSFFSLVFRVSARLSVTDKNLAGPPGPGHLLKQQIPFRLAGSSKSGAGATGA